MLLVSNARKNMRIIETNSNVPTAKKDSVRCIEFQNAIIAKEIQDKFQEVYENCLAKVVCVQLVLENHDNTLLAYST